MPLSFVSIATMDFMRIMRATGLSGIRSVLWQSATASVKENRILFHHSSHINRIGYRISQKDKPEDLVHGSETLRQIDLRSEPVADKSV
jgi:hypothetical protein